MTPATPWIVVFWIGKEDITAVGIAIIIAWKKQLFRKTRKNRKSELNF